MAEIRIAFIILSWKTGSKPWRSSSRRNNQFKINIKNGT
jgi:hypothetical protein